MTAPCQLALPPSEAICAAATLSACCTSCWSGRKNDLGLHLAWTCCRLDWGDDVLTLAPMAERFDPTDGTLLFRGLSAKTGIFEGDMTKIVPHTTSGKATNTRQSHQRYVHVNNQTSVAAGRADYFGTAVNKAARFLSACRAGQVGQSSLTIICSSRVPAPKRTAKSARNLCEDMWQSVPLLLDSMLPVPTCCYCLPAGVGRCRHHGQGTRSLAGA